MAEEDVTETPESTETPATETEAKAAAVAAVDNASKAELAELRANIAALTDTVKAAMTPRAAAPVAGKPGELPQQFRAILRQNGLTDADIDANAPVVIPFLMAMLQTDGQVMIGGIQQVRDEVEMVKARGSKKYPHWSDLEDKIVEMREEAEKQGRYLAPADAYKAAVAADLAAPESRIDAARARIKAAANSTDASATSSLQHTGSRPGQGAIRRTALTGEELAALPRAERKKYFESIGDLPIK